MEHSTDRILWTVLILAIGIALYVGFRPAIVTQEQACVRIITSNSSGVDSSSNSKFNYSVPDETNDTIAITGYTGHATNLVMPEYRRIGLKFYKITRINSWAFQGNTSLKSVTIFDNITEIENGTFQADSNLAYVDLPSSVTKIGDYAFQKDNISTINIPANSTIGKWAFNQNPITNVNFEGAVSLDAGAFQEDNISTVNIPANSTIGKWAFNQNPITNVNFEGAVSLDAGAFTKTKLSAVTLPKGSTYNSDFTNNNQSFEKPVKVNLVQ